MQNPNELEQGAGSASAGSAHQGVQDVTLLDAEREQRWNALQLNEPVQQAQIRIWTYEQGAVVLGRSQHRLADTLPASPGMLPLVKRGAGGGAVLVGPWLLSASILMPLDDPRIATASIADSYRWLGEAMVATLAELGVAVRTVPPAEQIRAPASLEWACFAGVAPWEIVHDDPHTGLSRKLVGFAQRRSRHGALLAVGVLMSPCPWRKLAEPLGQPPELADELAASTVDLATLCEEPVSSSRFVDTLLARLQPIVRI
ncbi:MAG: ligase [Lautropia sp.]|nr:ligase [Lautropia sp.]